MQVHLEKAKKKKKRKGRNRKEVLLYPMVANLKTPWAFSSSFGDSANTHATTVTMRPEVNKEVKNRRLKALNKILFF